jgi:hypothetical protein
MKGIADAELAVVSFDQISAVVSNIEKTDLVANQANVFVFAEVIEKLAKQFPLLPMRFGSVMESTVSVRNMLENNYPEFCQGLQKVKNKSEFGLKIGCDTEMLKENLRLKSEATDFQPISSSPEIEKSVYLGYIAKKLSEHRLEELLLARIDSIIAEFTGKLTQWDARSKIKKMTTASNIIDAVFLLNKEKEVELVQEVKELQSRHPELNYSLTGPWPPYNFVDITLK